MGKEGEKRRKPAGKDRRKVWVAAAESVTESERREVDSGGMQPAGGALSPAESACVKERRCETSEEEEEDDEEEEDVDEGRPLCCRKLQAQGCGGRACGGCWCWDRAIDSL